MTTSVTIFCGITSSPRYIGRKTKSGDLEALGFDQAMFLIHPEFSDKVFAQVIAPGYMLVTVADSAFIQDEEDDPVLDAFFSFIAKDISQHVVELDTDIFVKAKRLVEGIEP